MSRAPTFSEKVTLELRHDRGGVSHAWGIRGRRPGSVGRKVCGRGRERGDCGWSTAVRGGELWEVSQRGRQRLVHHTSAPTFSRRWSQRMAALYVPWSPGQPQLLMKQ